MSTQAEFISRYNDENRPRFNDRFFQKSDDEIIEDLKDMILSCQRESFYSIKVVGFEVIDDYNEVCRLILDKDTPMTISIKDSDLKILKVTYHIAMGDEEEDLDVYIAVPRVIDGAYIHLNGNDYYPLYQIVDGSTYNNTAAANKRAHSITLKTNFNAVRMIRDKYEYFTIGSEEPIIATVFSVSMFDRKVPLFEYFLSRFGYYYTLDYFNFTGLINISEIEPHDDNEYYHFQLGNSHTTVPVYLSVVKEIFDKDRVLQSLIGTIVHTVSKFANKGFRADHIYMKEFWTSKLGSNFVSTRDSAFAKGQAIIESVEHIYDNSTKKRIRLPEENKKDIYAIFKWMAGEFNRIRMKDVFDTTTKRIRWSEYIASMYIMKINVSMRRLPDKATDKNGFNRIKQAIRTQPLALISELQKSNLKGFRNMVNDKDSFLQLKYTIKGPSGPGDKNTKSISPALRAVHISQIGILDINTSSPTDPGVTGILCPLNQDIYENDSFTKAPEPNEWDKNFSELVQVYREKKSIRSALILAEDAGITLEPTKDIDMQNVAYEVSCLENTIKRVATSKGYIEEPKKVRYALEKGEAIILEN